MHKSVSSIISDLQKLQWPTNRNQMLQMLIKKQWDKRLFNSFFEILKETQKDEKFIDTFTKKVDDFMEGKGRFFWSLLWLFYMAIIHQWMDFMQINGLIGCSVP